MTGGAFCRCATARSRCRGRATGAPPSPHPISDWWCRCRWHASHANPLDGWQAAQDWPEDLGAGAVLRRYLRFLVAELDAEGHLAASSRAARSAATMLTDLLLDAVQDRSVVTGGRSMPEAGTRHVLRAEEPMRARLEEDISVASLAAELGIGTRALQLSFQRHRGATPRGVLAALRLDSAHQRLSAAAPGETVTSIALECGLPHLGRFAAQYRARFGEPPSVTLARALRR
jgi:AraC-like DNA-binding protein